MRIPNWEDVEKWANEKIEQARARNESIGVEEHHANAARGQIIIMKELLRLPKLLDAPMHDEEPD